MFHFKTPSTSPLSRGVKTQPLLTSPCQGRNLIISLPDKGGLEWVYSS